MKALIIEDEKFVREYLSSLLLNEFDIAEVMQAVDGESGWELFEQHSFQFIILDLLLPKLDGIKLAKRMLDGGRGHRILAISSECDDFTVREVTRSGILGFVSKKDMSHDIITEAVEEIFDGHVYYSSSVLEVLERIRNDPDAYFKVLSRRELQVLGYLAQQMSHEEIAAELGVSDFTVKRHRHNAMKKLNLKNESSLLHFALDKGILKHKRGLGWSG